MKTITKALRSIPLLLILASTSSWAAHPHRGATRHHGSHGSHGHRLAGLALGASAPVSGSDGAEPAEALAPERAKAWPMRGFDALVQTLSLPMNHPASQRALQMLGTAYKWGGTTEEEGMDCSGFVWRSFKDALDVVLPRTARDMAAKLQKVLPHELKPGDLVFFNTRGARYTHVGIYLGGAMFAHSPHSGAEARIDNLDQPYWLSAFNGARRAPDGQPTAEGLKAPRYQAVTYSVAAPEAPTMPMTIPAPGVVPKSSSTTSGASATTLASAQAVFSTHEAKRLASSPDGSKTTPKLAAMADETQAGSSENSIAAPRKPISHKPTHKAKPDDFTFAGSAAVDKS